MLRIGLTMELLVKFEKISPGAVGFYVLAVPYFKSANPYGWCNESIKTLAQHLHIHHITAGRYIAELKEKGLIKMSGNGRMYSPLIIQKKL